MNSEDLRKILKEYENRACRTVTIPLDEYDWLKDSIKNLHDENAELEHEMKFYRNILQELGLIGVSSKALVPGSVSYESLYNPMTYVTRYKVMFDIDTTKGDEND